MRTLRAAGMSAGLGIAVLLGTPTVLAQTSSGSTGAPAGGVAPPGGTTTGASTPGAGGAAPGTPSGSETSAGTTTASPDPNSSSAAAAASLPPPTTDPTEEPGRWGHQRQLTVRFGFSGGYRVGFQYERTGVAPTPCTEPGMMGSGRICTRAVANWDAAIGYGIVSIFEIEARFRFGLQDFTGTIPMAAGLGIRLYGGDTSRLKFAFGVAGLVDFTNGGLVRPVSTVDAQFRLEQGLHYDAHRMFGFTVMFGQTVSPFREALFFTIDAGISFQLRLP